MRKVVIIGAGHVGSHCGYTLAHSGITDEIVLVDVDKDKAYAQALDIADRPSSSKPYKTQREMVEEITPTLKVDELEIGKLYVIPSFSYNDTKVINIVSKYPSSITYKEISNLNTMSESAY